MTIMANQEVSMRSKILSSIILKLKFIRHTFLNTNVTVLTFQIYKKNGFIQFFFLLIFYHFNTLLYFFKIKYSTLKLATYYKIKNLLGNNQILFINK